MKKEDLLIQKLKLTKHPEGGYFKETYRSSELIPNSSLSKEFIGNRNVSTSIYFLLKSEAFSAFHKINQDEIWHFYEGSPIKIHQISPEGNYTFVILGNDILNNELPQYVVPAGYWFAAEVTAKNSYSLVGCTVAPGFDFKDFTMPSRKELTELFPQHEDMIKKLTR